MKGINFIHNDFLLENPYSLALYHDHVAHLPIIDYHNHLDPKEIAENKIFTSLSECWLNGDHYKWRAMRANAIPEKYITGNASDQDRFEKWAETVPFTMCNPLFHWTHLELKRYFDIDTMLSRTTQFEIYHNANSKLRTQAFSVQNLLKKMNVEVICTTDEPTDDLEYHKKLQNNSQLKVLPTFRPDKFLDIASVEYIDSIKKLEKSSGLEIESFDALIRALEIRIQYFHDLGGRLSDHGLAQLHALEYTESEINSIFTKRLNSEALSKVEADQFQMCLLFRLTEFYKQKNWAMQLHLGAIRNNNRRLADLYGKDIGCDSIGDLQQSLGLSHFLNKLEFEDKLPKTILYNLNPADNEVFATMAGNFNDSSIAGKVQWGSAWWFLDQKDGIEKQLSTLSNMSLISRFIGMLTDSRSFLSFPRHEYFRRVLCNVFGQQIHKGLLPNDTELVGEMAANICYYNAKRYFNF